MATREISAGGRSLTVHVEGASDGPAILYHHGTPATGLQFGPWVDDVVRRGARLVSYDRPGYGTSTPMRDRTVADAASDSAAIMDALGVDRFVTWGISGGGPHALACAALLGDRVAAAASLAGVVPFDAAGLNYFRGMGEENIAEFGLVMAGREYVEPSAERMAAEMAAARPDQIVESIATLVSAVDRVVLDGAIGEYWSECLQVAFREGTAGWVDDDFAFLRPFGFELAEISVRTLIVHGVQDRFVPVDHGRWLAGAIAGAEAWIDDREGHLTLIANRVPAVHEWLLSHL
jgi:pimeloyl-ACP methyl ester carboxylesterase